MASCCGAARGIENFGDDYVGFEGGEGVGFCSFEEDGTEIGERVVIGRGNGRGGACGRLRFVRQTHADVVRGDGDDRAGASVDFHVLAAVRPIPGSLQNGLRFGIGEDDGCFVVHVRVDVGLDLLRDRRDGERALAVHKPGHQIGTVTAEIEESAAAVELRIAEPTEKFRADIDFFWALVAIMDDDFADLADGSGMDEIVSGAVAAIPGSFVIDEDLGFCGKGGTSDGLCIFVGNGQRFFHHDRDRIARAEFDDPAVIEGRSVNEDGLRPHGAENFVEIGVVERWLEMELRGVLIEKGAVSFGDGNDLDIRAVEGVGEESLGVAVYEAGHGDPERRPGFGSVQGASKDRKKENPSN